DRTKREFRPQVMSIGRESLLSIKDKKRKAFGNLKAHLSRLRITHANPADVTLHEGGNFRPLQWSWVRSRANTLQACQFLPQFRYSLLPAVLVGRRPPRCCAGCQQIRDDCERNRQDNA